MSTQAYSRFSRFLQEEVSECKRQRRHQLVSFALLSSLILLITRHIICNVFFGFLYNLHPILLNHSIQTILIKLQTNFQNKKTSKRNTCYNLYTPDIYLLEKHVLFTQFLLISRILSVGIGSYVAFIGIFQNCFRR